MCRYRGKESSLACQGDVAETFGLTRISIGFCLRNNVFIQRKNLKNRLELAICDLLENGSFNKTKSYFVLKP